MNMYEKKIDFNNSLIRRHKILSTLGTDPKVNGFA